ncbi:MAG: hypothetical protein PHO48_01030 [Candidatus Gracilibacteria bacterium]|nr:hypothetical protein [Candidatus Gracilibacteria bacterium]MDD5179330.1 hypothetical protein [Candidatus Gracilibacteria bacterium]
MAETLGSSVDSGVEKIPAGIVAKTRAAVLANHDFEDCLGFPECEGMNPTEVLMLELQDYLVTAQKALDSGNLAFATAISNAMSDRFDYADILGVDTAEARKKLEDFNSQLFQKTSN